MSAAGNRPNARRTHTYTPPCSGIAAPSSALISADGTKNVTNSTTSQVNASPPAMATAPIVSTTTIAEISRNTVSTRVSSRCGDDASPGAIVAVPLMTARRSRRGLVRQARWDRTVLRPTRRRNSDRAIGQ